MIVIVIIHPIIGMFQAVIRIKIPKFFPLIFNIYV